LGVLEFKIRVGGLDVLYRKGLGQRTDDEIQEGREHREWLWDHRDLKPSLDPSHVA
jgi:hypothetical protein